MRIFNPLRWFSLNFVFLSVHLSRRRHYFYIICFLSNVVFLEMSCCVIQAFIPHMNDGEGGGPGGGATLTPTTGVSAPWRRIFLFTAQSWKWYQYSHFTLNKSANELMSPKISDYCFEGNVVILVKNVCLFRVDIVSRIVQFSSNILQLYRHLHS